MKRLLASHTGAYIAKCLKDTLKNFGLSTDKIYTTTTDNGSNMIRASNVLKLYQTHLIDDFLESNLPLYEQEAAYNTFIDVELKKHAKEISDDISGKYVFQIRCAAHTLELGVKDALLKCLPTKYVIENAREIVKKLRTDNIMNLIVQKKLPKPNIDCATRWSSTYIMISSLNSLRGFCEELALINSDLKTDDEFWTHIDHAAKILKFTADALTKLQSGNLVLSDVYGIFALLRLQFEQFPNDELARQLLIDLNTREKAILKTKPMLACVYLDPRFQCMLTDNEKNIAKQHLKMLYNKIEKMNTSEESNNESVISEGAADLALSEIAAENILEDMDGTTIMPNSKSDLTNLSLIH